MLDHDNRENYLDPVLYDLESSPFEAEGSWLLALARAAAGPVLELGCGTGRLTIPLAQQGIDMTGLEVGPQMLDHARLKAGDLPIQWLSADVRDFDLTRRYPLIFTCGGILEHLLTRPDQDAMLRNIWRHLTDEGRLVLDVGYKEPSTLVDGTEAPWFSYMDQHGHQVQVSGYDTYDRVHKIWHQTYYRRWQSRAGEAESISVRLALRYFTPQEVETLLHENGLRVLARYADWQGNPATQERDMQVYVCARR